MWIAKCVCLSICSHAWHDHASVYIARARASSFAVVRPNIRLDYNLLMCYGITSLPVLYNLVWGCIWLYNYIASYS